MRTLFLNPPSYEEFDDGACAPYPPQPVNTS